MNLLVVATLTKATGNAVTARRIAEHLATAHRVILRDACDATAGELRALVAREEIDAGVAVHALLGGAFLRVLDLPYALVLGGTDLYEAAHPLHQKQMAAAVAAADRLVAFSEENRARAVALWPCAAQRARVVPQAVDVGAIDATFSLRSRLGLGPSDPIALLPTAFRSVKDPMFAARAFAGSRAHLVVVGAALEDDYASEARAAIRSPNVHLLSELERPQLLAAMQEADVVLNTSVSEGMCGTILEAMALGTPVVARRNAGNASLVTSGENGILVDDASEIVRVVEALGANAALRARLVRNARARVARVHGRNAERGAYLSVVAGLEVLAPTGSS